MNIAIFFFINMFILQLIVLIYSIYFFNQTKKQNNANKRINQQLGKVSDSVPHESGLN